ncbi:MAG: ornithine cyclodeaminase family protein [Chloroflexi bacterium]|nr:ornithine cyclodeaminase family protein [Chloroflexota bacterium]
MALFITEKQVGQLLSMDAALAAVEEAERQLGLGQAQNIARRRLRAGNAQLHLMAAALPSAGVLGYKAYTVSRQGAKFLYMLYSAETGQLQAIIEADRLGQMRTGAASGVATKYMARRDASVLGVFGAGWQARSQVEAISKVRSLSEVRVFSRKAEHREACARELSTALRLKVVPVAEPKQAVQGCQIVATITTAREPVFEGTWLEPGTHINAAGSNYLIKAEVDNETLKRCAIIVTDTLETARLESGDLLGPIERGTVRWEQVWELGDVVAGLKPGRRSEQDITLFDSHGLALWDTAVAAEVYKQARAQGVGTEVGV